MVVLLKIFIIRLLYKLLLLIITYNICCATHEKSQRYGLFTMKNKKKAFTLSEILPVLAILGIVAALTIPVLVKRINQNQLIQAWRKAYSSATTSYIQVVMQDGGYPDDGGWSGPTCGNPTDDRFEMFKKYFRKIKECINTTGCWASNAESWSFASNTMYGFVSADGMYWTRCHSDYSHVCVDVNGASGPNAWGIDMYQILLGKTKITPSIGGSACALSNPQIINGRNVSFSDQLEDVWIADK